MYWNCPVFYVFIVTGNRTKGIFGLGDKRCCLVMLHHCLCCCGGSIGCIFFFFENKKSYFKT